MAIVHYVHQTFLVPTQTHTRTRAHAHTHTHTHTCTHTHTRAHAHTHTHTCTHTHAHTHTHTHTHTHKGLLVPRSMNLLSNLPLIEDIDFSLTLHFDRELFDAPPPALAPR